MSALRDPRAGQDQARTPARIALVGLRGSGKSTVGTLLGRELARPFVDLDREIERLNAESRPAESALRAGDILARLGEPLYRDLEARALRETLALRGPLVLATGGGVILRDENRALLRQETWVVWLEAPVEELARRLASDPNPRPPLTPAGRLTGSASPAELAVLRDARQGLYQEVAHLRIRTEGMSPAEVARLLRGGLGSPQA